MEYKAYEFTIDNGVFIHTFPENASLGLIFLTDINGSTTWDLKCTYRKAGGETFILFDTQDAKAETLLINHFFGYRFGTADQLIFETTQEIKGVLSYRTEPDINPATEEKQDATISKLQDVVSALGSIYSVLGSGAKESTLQAFKDDVLQQIGISIDLLEYIKTHINDPVVIESALKDPITGALRCIVENLPTGLATDAKLDEVRQDLDHISTILIQNVAREQTQATGFQDLGLKLASAVAKLTDIVSELQDLHVITDIPSDDIVTLLNNIYNKISPHTIIDNQFLWIKSVGNMPVEIDWNNNPALDGGRIRTDVDLSEVAKDNTVQDLSNKIIVCNTDSVDIRDVHRLWSFMNPANEVTRARVDNAGRIILSPDSQLTLQIEQRLPNTNILKFQNISLGPGQAYTISLNEQVIYVYSVHINTFNKDTHIELLEKWPNEVPSPFRVLDVTSDIGNNYANFEYLPLRPRKMENYFGITIKNTGDTNQTYHVYVEVGS